MKYFMLSIKRGAPPRVRFPFYAFLYDLTIFIKGMRTHLPVSGKSLLVGGMSPN